MFFESQILERGTIRDERFETISIYEETRPWIDGSEMRVVKIGVGLSWDLENSELHPCSPLPFRPKCWKNMNLKKYEGNMEEIWRNMKKGAHQNGGANRQDRRGTVNDPKFFLLYTGWKFRALSPYIGWEIGRKFRENIPLRHIWENAWSTWKISSPSSTYKLWDLEKFREIGCKFFCWKTAESYEQTSIKLTRNSWSQSKSLKMFLSLSVSLFILLPVMMEYQ